MEKTKSRKLKIGFIAVVVGCIAAAAALFIIVHTGAGERVTGLELVQTGTDVRATWDDMDSRHYEVTVRPEGGEKESFTVDTNEFVIRNVTPKTTYKVWVEEGTRERDKSGEDAEEIFVKAPQEIETAVDECDGFTKERFSLEAKAKGELSYASGNEKVASVDATGEVYLHKTGTAVIEVTAQETEEYGGTVKYVKVTVNPRSLKDVTPTMEYTSGHDVELSWNKVDFAKKYLIKKRNIATGKYETVATVKGSETHKEIRRIAGKYKVVPAADIHGTKIEGKSESVKVKAWAEDAKTYSSATVIKAFNSGDMVSLASVHGNSSATSFQSLAYKGDTIVAAYVSKSNTVGLFKEYDDDWNVLAAETVSDVTHANGITYNPNTNSIYVARNYSGRSIHDLAVFDADSFKRTGTITSPAPASGVAYDESNDCYYLSTSKYMRVTDSDFNSINFIYKARVGTPGDVGGYNGVIMACTWNGGSSSFIDLYRAKDGAYLGSYSMPFGEIESVIVDDGYLVVGFNHPRVVYRTVERVDI